MTADKRLRIAPDFKDFQDPRKIFSHLDRVLELRETGDTRPVHMTIGLTNYCNHKCPWCYINWYQAGRTSERSGAGDAQRRAVNADDRLISAVGEAVEMGLKAVTIVGDGEPTLHKKFVPYMRQLSEMGLDIGLFSNFSARNPEVVETIAEHCFFARCSLDAASPEVHRESHGSDDYELVISNLRRLVELRGDSQRPTIGIQFVTNQWNYWQLPEAARIYREIGVDYMTIKPALKNALNPAHPSNEAPIDEVFDLMKQAEAEASDTFSVYAKYPQFREVLEHTTNDARYYGKCHATPLSPYLDEDGSLELCGNLKGRGFTMGNIHDASFKEIWTSSQRQSCVNKIDLSTCPAGCRLDPLNKVLWDAFNPDTDSVHPNFV